MACLLVDTKPISDSVLDFVYWTLRNKLQWNLYHNSYISISTKCIGNVVWELSGILYRPQYVNAYGKRVWEGSTQHLQVCRDCWVRLIAYTTEHMPVKIIVLLGIWIYIGGYKSFVFAVCWVQYQSVVALSFFITISHVIRGNSFILQTPQAPSWKLLQDV